MEAALKALQMTLIVAQKGNKNSASDAGVAGLLLGNAVDGASLNVLINLPGLPDDLTFTAEAKKRLSEIIEAKKNLVSEILNAVAKNIV